MTATLEKRSKSKHPVHDIDGSNLNTADVFRVVHEGTLISISEETQARIQESRDLLERLISEDRVIYGVNTSLGALLIG